MTKRQNVVAGTAMTILGALYSVRAYAASCAGIFGYTGALQSCTTAQSGTYRFSLSGAKGADGYFIGYGPGYDAYGNYNYYGEYIAGFTYGGRGAFVSGDIFLNAGTTLTILVGGAGRSGNKSFGGGGGTFIAEAGTALAVAGGGGGAAYSDGKDGRATNSGPYGGISAPGGGGGGGGFSTDGTPSTPGFYNYEYAGKAFLNGGAGGFNGSYYGGSGGFGGGGAGSYSDTLVAFAGGGGGFSGGNSGSYGGGGGSYLFSGAENQFFGVSDTYDGLVSIELLEAPTAVPLPAGVGLLGTGIAALGGAGFAVRRRRKAALS